MLNRYNLGKVLLLFGHEVGAMGDAVELKQCSLERAGYAVELKTVSLESC